MIWSINWYIEGNEAWFVDCQYALLLHVNLESFEVKMVSSVPVENVEIIKSHPYCFKFEKKIFCLADRGENIYIFDLEKKVWKCIYIDNPEHTRLHITDIRKVNNKLFAFSSGLGKMICFSGEEFDIVEYFPIVSKIKENINYSWDADNCYIVNGKKVYAYDCVKNQVLWDRDLDKEYSNLLVENNNIWLTSNENIIKKIENGNEEKEYGFDLAYANIANNGNDFWIEDNMAPDQAFLYIISVEKSTWFIPLLTKNIIFIKDDNMENYEQINKPVISKSEFAKWGLSGQYSFLCKRDNRYIYMFSFSDNSIVIIDGENLHYEKKVLNIDNSVYREIMYKRNTVIKEEKEFLLSNFIEVIE